MSGGEGNDPTQITDFGQDNPTGVCKYPHRDFVETRLMVPPVILSVRALVWFKNLFGSVPVLAR